MAPVATNGNDSTQQSILQKEIEDEKLALRSRSSKSRSPFPKPPKFDDKLEEREYLKFRLAQAFRIFGHLGYDEGVAGHITVRVCGHCFFLQRPCDSNNWDVGSDSTRLLLGEPLRE